jgi:hypothetical protein
MASFQFPMTTKVRVRISEIYSFAHCIVLFEGDSMPSIAQLEERGTVKETLCDPEVTGSIPVRRIFCPAAMAMTMTHLAADSVRSLSLSLPYTPDYFLDG